MKKRIQLMMLLLLLCVMNFCYAQTFHYTCDFELAEDANGWTFKDGTTNKWYIGTTVNATSGGTKSMYVSSSIGGVSHTYDSNTVTYMYSYRTFRLESGVYSLSYNWMAKGQGTTYGFDYMRAALVPDSLELGTTVPGSFAQKLPAGWIALDGGSSLNNSDVWTMKNAEAIVPSTGNYKMVFFWVNNNRKGKNPPASVDDIDFKMLECPRPLNAHVIDMGMTWADIEWSASASSDSWNVVIVNHGSDISTGETVACSDSMISFSNLLANTKYDVYITANCDNDVSNATKITFTTLNMDPISLPYNTDFTNTVDNELWSFVHRLGTNKWKIGNATSHYNMNALYVSNDNGVSNNYGGRSNTVTLAYIPIRVDVAGMHTISYDWKCKGETTYDFGRVAIVPIEYDLSQTSANRNDYKDPLPEGWIAVDNGLMNLQESWMTTIKKVDLSMGAYYLVFVWVNDGGSNRPPAMAVDNISFGLSGCPDPMNLGVEAITDTTVMVKWDSDEMVTNGWEVKVDDMEPMVVLDTTYLVEGMAPGVGRKVSVRSICSGDMYSVPSEIVVFSECSDIKKMPYIKNFDYDTVNRVPRCWTAMNNSSIVLDGELQFNCLTMRDSVNLISMPRLASRFDVSRIEMTFRAKRGPLHSNSPIKLGVGVCTVAGEDTTFSLIEEYELNNSWDNYFVSFEDYSGNGRYLSFRLSSGDAIACQAYVDDIELTEISPCGRPMDLFVESYTHNSAKIRWSDTNSMATYRLAVGLSENDSSALVFDNITTKSYDIQNLDGLTTYYVWVESECTNWDTTSGWVYVDQFTTLPTCQTITNISVYDIDETHATVSWNAPIGGEMVTDYIVTLTAIGEEPRVDTIQVPYMFLSNLTPDATYTISVKTKCFDYISDANTCTFVASDPMACNAAGNGRETTGLPINRSHDYSLSQSIYWAEELVGMSDTINGVIYTRAHDDNFPQPDNRNIEVYMGMTDLMVCNEGWIDTADLVKVFSGYWHLTDGGCPIMFNRPFIYNDRSKNLVIMMHDITGSDMNSSIFYGTKTAGIQSISKSNSEMDVNMNINLPYNNIDIRPNVKFSADCRDLTCMIPSVVIDSISDTYVSAVWQSRGGESAWIAEYREMNSNNWIVINNLTNNTLSIDSLMPGTDYLLRIGSVCGNEIYYRTMHFATLCGTMSLPFKEDFTYESRGEFNKNCWYSHNDTYYGKLVTRNSSITNNSVLVFSNNGYVVLPQMDRDLSELQIRFRYFSVQDTVGAIVGYIINPSDIASFHPVDTVYDVSGGLGIYDDVIFDNVAFGTHGRMAIYIPSPSYLEVEVDDIIVEPIRTCLSPTDIQVNHITSNSAMISWMGTSGRYVLEYGESGYERMGEVPISAEITGNTYTIQGLHPGTYYDFILKTICADGDTSYASDVFSFETSCAPITEFPYVMNFDMAYLPQIQETGVMPNCWTVAYMRDTNILPEEYPQIVREGFGHNFAVNGKYALRMNRYGIVALPEMGVDVDTLCLRFYNRSKTISSRIVIGVLDNVDEGCESTFQVVDTIVPYSTRYNELYSVYFKNYTGSGKYIAIKNIDANNAVGTSVQYFDSIVVDYIPLCPEVINPEVVYATGTTVTVDWEDVNGPASSYEIVYGETGFDLATEGMSVIATTHPYAITDLEGLTNYEIWIRPICSATDTGTFYPHPIVAQTSICNLPIVNSAANNSHIVRSMEYPFAVYYKHNYTQTIIDATYLIGQNNIEGISFKAAKPSLNKMQGINIYLGHTDKTQFDSVTDWCPISSLSLVYSGNLQYEEGSVIIRFDTSFFYDGHSNLVVAIDRDCNNWVGNHYFENVSDTIAKTLYFRDNDRNQDPNDPIYEGVLANAHAAFSFISCDECHMPLLLPTTGITYESATINWESDDRITYDIAIRMQDEVAYSDTITVTDGSYTFTNLESDKEYVYGVRQYCALGVVSDWAEATFTTNLPPCLVPTSLSVESTSIESITLSWSAPEEQSTWAIHIFNMVEDRIDTVVSNPACIEGLIDGLTYNVAIKAICAPENCSEWSDTIEVSTDNCLPVSNVTISDITKHSARVTWNAGGNEISWNLVYGKKGFEYNGTGEIAVNAASYMINSLEPETEYDVYVRAMCTETVGSLWSEVVHFKTLEDNQESIDGVEGDFQFSIYPNPTSASTTISLVGVEGRVIINVVDMNGRMVASELIECGVDCEKRIDISNLAQGTYFVCVFGDNINSVRKLIVR